MERTASSQAVNQVISVLCVDDHPMVREGFRALIGNYPDMHVVGTAATGREAIEEHRRLRPDITLLDLKLPDMTGIDVLTAIREERKDARIIVVTTFSGDAEIQRALAAGAYGYVLKSMPMTDLFHVIRQVQQGKRYVPEAVAKQLAEHLGFEPLTAREIEVLGHLAEGNRNRDIARKLNIAEDTVKAHLRNILEKLGASDRTQAVAIGVRRGFIHL